MLLQEKETSASSRCSSCGTEACQTSDLFPEVQIESLLLLQKETSSSGI